MNSPTTNQNDKPPNYDFILKESPPLIDGKKKVNKKIILLIVLSVITVVILIVGALLSARENVVEEGSSDNAVASVDTQAAEPVVKDFLSQVAKGDYEAAYRNVAVSEDSEFTKDEFINNAVPVLNTLKLEECILAQEDVSENVVVFGCSAKTSDTVVNLEFVMVSQDDQVKIVYFRLGQVA